MSHLCAIINTIDELVCYRRFRRYYRKSFLAQHFPFSKSTEVFISIHYETHSAAEQVTIVRAIVGYNGLAHVQLATCSLTSTFHHFNSEVKESSHCKGSNCHEHLFIARYILMLSTRFRCKALRGCVSSRYKSKSSSVG